MSEIVNDSVKQKYLIHYLRDHNRVPFGCVVATSPHNIGISICCEKDRFNKLLGANYNARYLKYLLNINHNKPSVNCFQSIGFILNEKEWWKIKPNYRLKILD
jgi:hypothetical protein